MQLISALRTTEAAVQTLTVPTLLKTLHVPASKDMLATDSTAQVKHFFYRFSITVVFALYNLYVLYSMPAAGKLSLGDSVQAAAKLA